MKNLEVFLFVFVLLFKGCLCANKNMDGKRESRHVFLGQYEEVLSGIYIGEAWVSEHHLSFEQIARLIEVVPEEDEVIFEVPPYEGLAWIDAMAYCAMIQSNSVAKGCLKPGEIVRLPTVREVATLLQQQSSCLTPFSEASKNMRPSTVAPEDVYEWTCDPSEDGALAFACVSRGLSEDDHEMKIQMIDAFHAYLGLFMRLVIAPEDEQAARIRVIASKAEAMIWNMERKQYRFTRPIDYYRKVDKEHLPRNRGRERTRVQVSWKGFLCP
jgi:hypothetical protein